MKGQGLGQNIGLNYHATYGGSALGGAVDDLTAGFGSCVDRVAGSAGALERPDSKNSFRFTAIVNARNAPPDSNAIIITNRWALAPDRLRTDCIVKNDRNLKSRDKRTAVKGVAPLKPNAGPFG